MSLTEKIGTGVLASTIGTGVVVLVATTGAGFGALGGQILDMCPYFNHAIPEGIAYLGNAFTEQDTVEKATKGLRGNLDKIGAVAGFLGGYFRVNISTK